MRQSWNAVIDGCRRIGRAPTVLIGTGVLILLVGWPTGVLIDPPDPCALPPSVATTGCSDSQAHRALGSPSLLAHLPPIVAGAVIAAGGGGLTLLARARDHGTFVLVVAVLTCYVAFWVLMSGAIVSRLVHDTASPPALPRRWWHVDGALARLGVIDLVGAWIWLNWFGTWIAHEVDPTVAAGLAAGLLVVWTALGDVARIRTVAEGRHVAIGAWFAAARFVFGHPKKAGMWCACLGIVWFALTSVGAVAMQAMGTSHLVGGLVAAGTGIVTRLLFLGSGSSLFLSMARARVACERADPWPAPAAGVYTDPSN